MNKIDLDLDFEDLEKDLEITAEQYKKLAKLSFYELLLVKSDDSTCVEGNSGLYLIENQAIIAVVEEFKGKNYVYNYIYNKFADNLHCLAYLIISIDTIYYEWKASLYREMSYGNYKEGLNQQEMKLNRILNKYAEAFK